MDLKNCKKCGKLHYGTGPVCSDCLKKEEEKFETVRAFLKENPNSTITLVSQETGVTAQEIERYIREGRLEATMGLEDAIRCIKCGTPIKSGRYCSSCEKRVKDKMKTAYGDRTSPKTINVDTSANKPRMHYTGINKE